MSVSGLLWGDDDESGDEESGVRDTIAGGLAQLLGAGDSPEDLGDYVGDRPFTATEQVAALQEQYRDRAGPSVLEDSPMSRDVDVEGPDWMVDYYGDPTSFEDDLGEEATYLIEEPWQELFVEGTGVDPETGEQREGEDIAGIPLAAAAPLDLAGFGLLSRGGRGAGQAATGVSKTDMSASSIGRILRRADVDTGSIRAVTDDVPSLSRSVGIDPRAALRSDTALDAQNFRHVQRGGDETSISGILRSAQEDVASLTPRTGDEALTVPSRVEDATPTSRIDDTVSGAIGPRTASQAGDEALTVSSRVEDATPTSRIDDTVSGAIGPRTLSQAGDTATDVGGSISARLSGVADDVARRMPGRSETLAAGGTGLAALGVTGNLPRQEDGWFDGAGDWISTEPDPGAPSAGDPDREPSPVLTGTLNIDSVPAGAEAEALVDIHNTSNESARPQFELQIQVGGQWGVADTQGATRLGAGERDRFRMTVPAMNRTGRYNARLIAFGDAEGIIDESTLRVTEGDGTTPDDGDEWGEATLVGPLGDGWHLFQQANLNNDDTRYIIAGTRDGQTVYLHPGADISTDPHFYDTSEEAAEAFQEYLQAVEDGDVGDDERPDPDTAPPDGGEVTDDARTGWGGGGTLGTITDAAGITGGSSSGLRRVVRLALTLGVLLWAAHRYTDFDATELPGVRRVI